MKPFQAFCSKAPSPIIIFIIVLYKLIMCNTPINVNPQRGRGRAYVGYLIINCICAMGF